MLSNVLQGLDAPSTARGTGRGAVPSLDAPAPPAERGEGVRGFATELQVFQQRHQEAADADEWDSQEEQEEGEEMRFSPGEREEGACNG